MSNKKDIKISDKLLSWVLGCECEFENIVVDSKCNKIETEAIYFKMFIESLNRPRLMPKTLNLHTFIHIAKIKANLAGYKISQHWNKINVKYDCNYKSKRFDKYKHEVKDRFSIREIIDCLEWVAEKVGGEE